MYIYPILEGPVPAQTMLMIDTPHNYWGSMEFYTTVALPGAVGYYVSFDNRSNVDSSDCDYGCDFISLYESPLENVPIGVSPYSGGVASDYNWFQKFAINTSEFTIMFATGRDIVDWGFKLQVYPIFSNKSAFVIEDMCPSNSTLAVDELHGNTSCECNPAYSQVAGNAALTHKFSFNNGADSGPLYAEDSVGGSDGELGDGAYVYNNSLLLYSPDYSSIVPYLQLPPNTFTFNSMSLSIELWISTSAINSQSGTVLQFGENNKTNANSVQLSYSSGSTFMLTLSDNSIFETNIGSKGCSSLHLVVVFTATIKGGITNQPTTALEVYANAALTATYSNVANIPTDAGGAYLGRSFGSSLPGAQILIDEFRVWNGSLTADDVYTSYLNGPSNLPCFPCRAGTYSYTNGSTSCVICPGNSSSVEGSTSCVCNSGYATTGFASSLNCTVCPGGTYNAESSETCDICSNGTYSHVGSSICDETPAGYYSLQGSSSYSSCPGGTYSPNNSAVCYPCQNHSSSNATSFTCYADDGYYQVGEGLSMSVFMCPDKYYSNHYGQTSCTECAPGYKSLGAGQTHCEICPLGYYSQDTLTSIVCTRCPSGRTTATDGSTSLDDCLNLALNFALGLLLSLFLFMSIVYTVYGRVVISGGIIIREELVKSAWYGKKIYDCYLLMKECDDEKKRKDNETRSPFMVHCRTVLIYTIFLLSIVVLLMLTILVVVNKIFFSSLIIVRSYEQASVVLHSYHEALELWVDNLSGVFGSFPFVTILLRLAFIIANSLKIFQINLDSIDLTCSGAQAPAELFGNLLILFLVVIIAQGDYPIFLSQSLLYSSKSYVRKFSSWYREPATLCISASWFIFCSIKPWKYIMQYLMTLVTLDTFFKDRGIHKSTPACNSIPGAEGFDTAMATIGTTLTLLIAPVAFYTVVIVVYPKLCVDLPQSDYIAHKEHSSIASASNNGYVVKLIRFISLERVFQSTIRNHQVRVKDLSWQVTRVHYDGVHKDSIVSHDSNSRIIKGLELDSTLNDIRQSETSLRESVGVNIERESYCSDKTKKQEVKHQLEELPSYLSVCINVRREIPCLNCLGTVGLIISMVPLVQLYTEYGRVVWYNIIWKLTRFTIVCCGVWTEGDVVKFSLTDKLLNFMHPQLVRENFLEAAGALIEIRAILWQAIPVPVFTIFSQYAVEFSSAPLFIPPTVAKLLSSYVGGEQEEEQQENSGILEWFSKLARRREVSYSLKLVQFTWSLLIVFCPADIWESRGLFGFVTLTLFAISLQQLALIARTVYIYSKASADLLLTALAALLCGFGGGLLAGAVMSDDDDNHRQLASSASINTNTNTSTSTSTSTSPTTTITNPLSGGSTTSGINGAPLATTSVSVELSPFRSAQHQLEDNSGSIDPLLFAPTPHSLSPQPFIVDNPVHNPVHQKKEKCFSKDTSIV